MTWECWEFYFLLTFSTLITSEVSESCPSVPCPVLTFSWIPEHHVQSLVSFAFTACAHQQHPAALRSTSPSSLMLKFHTADQANTTHRPPESSTVLWSRSRPSNIKARRANSLQWPSMKSHLWFIPHPKKHFLFILIDQTENQANIFT